jgi:hypothetical protein
MMTILVTLCLVWSAVVGAAWIRYRKLALQNHSVRDCVRCNQAVRSRRRACLSLAAPRAAAGALSKSCGGELS